MHVKWFSAGMKQTGQLYLSDRGVEVSVEDDFYDGYVEVGEALEFAHAIIARFEGRQSHPEDR